MKLEPQCCRSAYDRPDYQRIHRASYGNLQTRIEIARRLLLDRHTDCRAFDNCFECGDGDQVVHALIHIARKNEPLRRAIAENYSDDQLTDGLPTRWLQTFQEVESQECPLFQLA